MRHQLTRERRVRERAESIAKRKLRQLRRQREAVDLVEATVSTADRASSADEALEFSVNTICQQLRFSVGHRFVLSAAARDDAPRFEPSNVWYCAEPTRFASLQAATNAEKEACMSHGLPGLVLAKGKPIWVSDLARETRFPFPRVQSALAAGLRTAFAFPVQECGKVTAILEFFTEGRSGASPALLHALDRIGTQLGLTMERQRFRDRLIYEAFHDPLTTLPNRAKLLERLQLILEHSKRRPQYRFALLFIDLDRFKWVNDSLGHAYGDALISEASRRLAACVRREDLVARNISALEAGFMGHIVARLGGDEFTVILEDIRGASDAMRVAQRIQEAFSAPFVLANQNLYISASIGIALNTADHETAQDVLRDADIAMYRAKARGRGCHELFDQAMGAHAKKALKLETELHEAVERREFQLLYQPFLSVDDSTIRGFEALLRWRHPERGLLLPDQFLPTIEETGLIRTIGRWVREEACRQARRWQNAFPSDPPLAMSINVSASEFNEEGFVDHLSCVLNATGLPPPSLILELTETVAMANLEQAQRVFAQIKELGVRLSLDDFGTGHSSLSSLRRLPIDVLKVDRSFVNGLDCNEGNQHVLEMIVMLARAFNMRIVAEGPETVEEFTYLKRLGCHYVQGFYFHRPLSEAAATAELRKQRQRSDEAPDADIHTLS